MQAVADRTFWGRITESAVGAHLFNTATPDIKPLLLAGEFERGGFCAAGAVLELVAIEVKSGLRKTASTSGMAEFAKAIRICSAHWS